MAVDSTAVVQALGRLDAQRKRDYRRALDFFDGAQWERPVRARARERQLVFNYTRALVEKVAAFTLKGLDWSVPVFLGDGSEGEDQAAKRALDRVYEENDIEQLDFDTEVDCSVLGDAAYKVWWDVDARRVLVGSIDPQELYVWTLPGSYLRYWRVAQRYRVDGEELALLGLQRPGGREVRKLSEPAPSERQGRGERRQHEVVEVWQADLYERFLDGARVEAKANPYGWIPFVVYPNVRKPKRFWGESDVVAVRESQLELNRLMSQLSLIGELSGNPVTVLEGVQAAQDIAVAPGALWELPEKSRAYLLDLLSGGGVKVLQDQVGLVYRTLHDLGESPRVAFGEADTALSGVALELQLDPLVKKVERKRLIRQVALRERSRMVLALLNQYTGTAYPTQTRVAWGALLPTDRQRLVQDEALLVGAGVHSRRTAAELTGIDDAESEFEQWRREERRIAAEEMGPGPPVDDRERMGFPVADDEDGVGDET